MSTGYQYSVHEEPVWRERADFVINAQLDERDRREQLWARKLGDRTFELCCIPLFAYDLALGDGVETDPALLLTRVYEPSGRYVFRVWFGGTGAPRQPIADALAGLGALTEWGSGNLLAVDAADEDLARRIGGYLEQQEQHANLIFETGRTSASGERKAVADD